VAAATTLPTKDALIDGEVAIVLPDGRTSFQLLQNAFSGEKPKGALVYFVFDLLRLDGEKLERLPLVERKARLRSFIGKRKSIIRYADHVEGNARTFFDQACGLGLEGIISKRASAPYHSGRHGEWVKTKCVFEQEFVIGGFTDPEGSRAGIGALLIGYYDRGHTRLQRKSRHRIHAERRARAAPATRAHRAEELSFRSATVRPARAERALGEAATGGRGRVH
jgi:bifunctional non-homologous end joining protein LigD